MAKLHNPLEKKGSPKDTLKRYTLDLRSGDVNVFAFEPKSDIPNVNGFDFPTMNENYRSREYCYA